MNVKKGFFFGVLCMSVMSCTIEAMQSPLVSTSKDGVDASAVSGFVLKMSGAELYSRAQRGASIACALCGVEFVQQGEKELFIIIHPQASGKHHFFHEACFMLRLRTNGLKCPCCRQALGKEGLQQVLGAAVIDEAFEHYLLQEHNRHVLELRVPLDQKFVNDLVVRHMVSFHALQPNGSYVPYEGECDFCRAWDDEKAARVQRNKDSGSI